MLFCSAWIFLGILMAPFPVLLQRWFRMEAWTRLSRLYSKRSTTHIIHLKDKLTSMTHGSLSVTDFLMAIKQISDKLTVLGDLSSDADLPVYTTHGLGPTYKELINAMRTRDTVVPFEELFDKIFDYETFLLHNEKQYPDPTPPTTNLAKKSSSYYHPPKSLSLSFAPGLLPNPASANKQYKPTNSYNSNSNSIVCQFCRKHGYDAKRCFKLFPQDLCTGTPLFREKNQHDLYE
ncbi:uncharacterized protein LOC110414241 [Herrania umbratica]|uniref:Uncharacterized protein LOC110414241 n=1 Tax=Herrania umbratica TaxID=108875 RepID=A0A6J1A2V3_9ROSI|nr:uncharacterized protein LOC110414241 [Herrania umbratica]